MSKKLLNIIILVSILFFITTGFSFFGNRTEKEPQSLYQVYLDGKVIGVIKSKDDLLNLIDREQKYLKNKYDVDKVYPPEGLEIRRIVTYSGKVDSISSIYDKIKDSKSFTLKGYTITIKDEDGKKRKINVLNKEDFDKAVTNTIEAFVPSDTYEDYLNSTQEEVTETGTTLENVEIKEDVTYKENYISTEEQIFTDYQELSRYLLFGTLDKQKEYTVKNGDTLPDIANSNNLSIEELLIANPEIKSENTLVFPGQKLNIGLIDPMLSIVVTSQVIEEQVVRFKTEETYDKNVPMGTDYVEQEGENGLNKVTIKKEEVNGETTYLLITDTEQISPVINKVVRKGSKKTDVATGDWAWPTISPYVITSPFGWRWGRMHEGIDISGCGHGSPIYASNNGRVYELGYNSGASGTYILINHNNGYFTSYLHLADIYVKEGQVVQKGQIIGSMGNTGRSTGTHLHFGLTKGYTWTGQELNPLILFK